MGLQVIFTLISFLSFLEDGDGEGCPCVPVDVGMSQAPKQVGKREQFRNSLIHPFSHPYGVASPPTNSRALLL